MFIFYFGQRPCSAHCARSIDMDLGFRIKPDEIPASRDIVITLCSTRSKHIQTRSSQKTRAKPGTLNVNEKDFFNSNVINSIKTGLKLNNRG